MSVPLGDPIVCLTVVTVNNEARAPMNTEKITSPTTNQTMANIFAGTDLGQRSPYLNRYETNTLSETLFNTWTQSYKLPAARLRYFLFRGLKQ